MENGNEKVYKIIKRQLQYNEEKGLENVTLTGHTEGKWEQEKQ